MGWWKVDGRQKQGSFGSSPPLKAKVGSRHESMKARKHESTKGNAGWLFISQPDCTRFSVSVVAGIAGTGNRASKQERAT